MALKAIFVGINRYLDPAIPEMSGARRDSWRSGYRLLTALRGWLLFGAQVRRRLAR